MPDPSALQPGPEADEWVAVHVCRWHKRHDLWRRADDTCTGFLVSGMASYRQLPAWSPSTDSRHAVQAAGVWCEARGRLWDVQRRSDGRIVAYIRPHWAGVIYHGEATIADAPTDDQRLALAIYRALRAAVEGQDGKET